MRYTPFLVAAVAIVALPANAWAMSRDVGRVTAGRPVASDPDERLERMAAASMRGDTSRDKPRRSARAVLKNDPYLSEAFAWLDNK